MTLLAPGDRRCSSWARRWAPPSPTDYADFLQHRREDFPALRQASAPTCSASTRPDPAAPAPGPLRSRNIDIVYVHDANRVLAFRRWEGGEEVIVVASLNDANFGAYRIQNTGIGDAVWREVLNSDDQRYGGSGHLNANPINSTGGVVSLQLPANGIVVLQRQ